MIQCLSTVVCRCCNHILLSTQSTWQVNITILDQNDNSPEFTSSFPEPVTVSESTDADVTIVTVVATDPDQGEAGQVTYHLLSYSQSGNFHRLFSDFAFEYFILFVTL